MYLNSKYKSSQSYFGSEELLKETGIGKEDLLVLISQFCEKGFLEASVNVRCPECDADYGRFRKKSEVPDENQVCFSCGGEFRLNNTENWRIVYKVLDLPEKKELELRLRKYAEECYDLSRSDIEEEFEELKKLEPKKRGRVFDYFVGLLFQQIEGVDVRIKQPTKEGEVDVHLVLSDANDKLKETCGTHTMVENKWESSPTGLGEITKFHGKVSELPQMCFLSYFMSVNGFSKDAQNKCDRLGDPAIISWERKELEEMVYNGKLEDIMYRDSLR